jgi:hypothetical protein
MTQAMMQQTMKHHGDVHALAARLGERVPEDVREQIERLAGACCPPGRPLRLIVLGAFSVGKSTLLNTLIGEAWLHAAKQEATALPTFIEYGAVPATALVGIDGSELPVDAAGFRAAIACAPQGAACATLALPLSWLEGVSLIDLPGLGSVSAERQQYTAAQVRQADAVLYLLDPRGPGQADVDALRTVEQYGKRAKVVVARWDEVLAAQARGEPTPSLDAWTAQIEAQAGLRARLTGVSRDGTGRDEVIDFVARARAGLDAIRLRRFRAELRPLLLNALGLNEEARRACMADTEQAVAVLHANMMQQKQELFDLKASLYARQQDDRDGAVRAADAAVRAQRGDLERELGALASGNGTARDWEAFQQQGGALVRAALAGVATALSGQSARYGVLALPEGEVERLDIRLPPLASVEVTDFVDAAKMAALERAIHEKQLDIAASERRLGATGEGALNEVEDALRERMRVRAQVAAQPLRLVTEIVPGNGAAEIGKAVGELADIALMFVEPASAGAKAGAIVGNGAKAAKTAKIAESAAAAGSAAASAAAGGMRVMETVKEVAVVAPRPKFDKLGMLQALSLSFWGERIGMALGGAPRERQVVDQAALAEREQALAALDHEIAQARRELARRQDIVDEQRLTGWALEQGQRDLAHLQGEVESLAAQREQRGREALEMARAEHDAALERVAQRAVQEWVAGFDREAAAMAALLAGHVAAYWEGEVETAVGARAAAVDGMLERLRAAPEVRDAALAALEGEALALNACLEELA